MNVRKRYIGKPLLRLLECYVLRAIGKLTAEEESSLESMSPKLRQVYKADGSWFDILASVMGFPESLPSQINAIWERNCDLAKANGEELVPQDFAEMFVDKNFPT